LDCPQNNNTAATKQYTTGAMGITRTKPRATSWLRLFFLCFVCSCFLAAEIIEATESTESTETESSFDEDELVQETIAAGRGHRDEQGVRDQWLSDEHLGKEGVGVFDSRKPISEDVKRLLTAYRLKCEGCDHKEAVKKVNAYNRETKRLAREEKKARERKDSWARKIFSALLVASLSAAYVHRKKLGLEFLLNNGKKNDDDLRGFTEAQKANILKLRREQAADAASKRQQGEASPPSWIENEKKEVWTRKQEKQFQKALNEFFGVPKKERYKLIAEKVDGKSRIECLTHHRMQELLAKQKEQQQ
jgi:hypothetical protein